MSKIRGIRKVHSITRNLHQVEIGLRRRIWHHWHNPIGQTMPGFLVGCGRSGTNMLVFHLSKLWQVELYNEDNPAAFQNWRLRDLSIIERLIARSHAQITIFKPILDTYRTNVLLSRFPTARLIFIFRHHTDVINSSLKKFGITNRIDHVNSWIKEDFDEFASAPPPENTKAAVRSRWKPSLSPESGAALYWLFQNRLYFDLGLHRNERVMLINYETVVSEPLREFERICQFLGVAFKPELAEGVYSSSVKRDPAPRIAGEILADCDDLWRSLCQELDSKKGQGI